MAQGQIFVMTGSLGPDILFETLISNFDLIQKGKKKFLFVLDQNWILSSQIKDLDPMNLS